MLSAVKKFGHSAGLLIPKPLLAEFGAQVGDHVQMRVEDGRLVIEHVTAPPRRGWAEDAKRLAETGDDALAWPESGNTGDDELTW